MRLVHTSELCIYDFKDDAIPPYSILSHTWGQDEVTYHEFLQGKRSEKIRTCCRLASSESWDYVWIDTCCIDKSSSAELSEAINSMYRWYQNSEVCYAYLEDFGENGQDFEQSRWFTRGWTLQELLAPTHVIFLDRYWKMIGSRKSLEENISKTTRIQFDHLSSPFSASAAAKMSWVSDRKTTRVEDMAYCLLGLFQVNMPLLYGEGDRAFIRLQEEIIRQSDDQSIFAWIDKSLEFSGMLARHPSAFAKSGDIVQTQKFFHEPRSPYRMTNRGLEIQFPVFDEYCEPEDADGGDKTDGSVRRYEVPLECSRPSYESKVVFITLRKHASGKVSRINAFGLHLLTMPKEMLEGRLETFIVASDLEQVLYTSEEQSWETPILNIKSNNILYAQDISSADCTEYFQYTSITRDYKWNNTRYINMDAMTTERLLPKIVDYHRVITMYWAPIDTRESRSVYLEYGSGRCYALYWRQIPHPHSPPTIHLFKLNRVKGRPSERSYSSEHVPIELHLDKLDIFKVPPLQFQNESIVVRLRHTSHYGRHRLVIDVQDYRVSV